MNIIIEKSVLNGKISAISSKSHAHRALICASLSNDGSYIKCDNISKDIEATVNCLNGLGAEITYKDNVFCVKPININNATKIIDCGESGSTLRFLLPIIAALGLDVDIKMHGRLPDRPLFPLDREMIKHGCTLIRENDTLHISGQLKSADFEIEGNISSQFITGLLFAIPILKGKSRIIVKGNLESYSYILLTLDVLKDFGIEYKFENNVFELIKNKYNAKNIEIEGDWSNAAFWICAGALLEKGLTVENINFNSKQGDKKIIDIVKEFGANVEICGSIANISANSLKGIVVDASDIPDLVPIIAITACNAEGKTIIKNAGRLRIKESDRIKSVVEMINNLGGIAEETDDGMIITGCKLLGGVVNSYNDHRIAMSATIASLICENEVKIINAESVEKSYPMFYNDFKKLGGIYKEEENE